MQLLCSPNDIPFCCGYQKLVAGHELWNHLREDLRLVRRVWETHGAASAPWNAVCKSARNLCMDFYERVARHLQFGSELTFELEQNSPVFIGGYECRCHDPHAVFASVCVLFGKRLRVFHQPFATYIAWRNEEGVYRWAGHENNYIQRCGQRPTLFWAFHSCPESWGRSWHVNCTELITGDVERDPVYEVRREEECAVPVWTVCGDRCFIERARRQFGRPHRVPSEFWKKVEQSVEPTFRWITSWQETPFRVHAGSASEHLSLAELLPR